MMNYYVLICTAVTGWLAFSPLLGAAAEPGETAPAGARENPSDQPAGPAEANQPPAPLLIREMKVDKRYLLLPVRNGAASRQMAIDIDPPPPPGCGPVAARRVHLFNIRLAERDPDWWAFVDLSEYQGRKATVSVNDMAPGTHGMAALEMSDTIRSLQPLYDEATRPQLRFSQARGFNGDPNGMVYYDGEYHLSWQSNPFGLPWGNMYWGHAVSEDLVHWKELPPTLRPSVMARGMCFSGSAAVDVYNTAGFRTGAEKVIVAAFSDTGTEGGECLAYSNDRGRTFTYYEGNPVFRHHGRDPKIIWYTPPTDKSSGATAAVGTDEDPKRPRGWWVMAIYEYGGEIGRRITFYTSDDLKQWTEQSCLPGYYECAELFALPVLDAKGEPTSESRWVVYSGNAEYAVGRFDGKVFTSEHEGKHKVHWGCYYASQTFSQTPGNRRVQIGFARVPTVGMPFNQAFSLPTELTLRRTDAGIRMFAEPIQELESLRGGKHLFEAGQLKDGVPAAVAVSGQLFDILLDFEPGTAESVELQFGAQRLVYDVKTQSMSSVPIEMVGGAVRLRIIVDRPMFEVCANYGSVYYTWRRPDPGKPIPEIRLTARGGTATLKQGVVYEMQSIWPKAS